MPTTYILGAGASAGFDRSFLGLRCPSSKNFFPVAFGILKEKQVDAMFDYSNLLFFLKKYYRLSPDDLESSGLDMQDILTFLDLEVEYSDSNDEITFLIKARNEFMNLLCSTYGKALEGSPCPYHGALASSLSHGDTVISFNYDLLIDIAMHQNCCFWNPESGYGFNASVANWDISRSNISGKDALLLKLHGSFNWVTGKNSNTLHVLPLEHHENYYQWPSFGNLLSKSWEPLERF